MLAISGPLDVVFPTVLQTVKQYLSKNGIEQQQI